MIHPVLVVDDDEFTRSLIAQLLTRHGYSVETAEDGIEAMARVQDSARYAAMILDFALPGADGKAVIDFVASERPDLLQRTIVATAFPGIVEQRGIPSVCEILPKPVDVPVLLTTLERLTRASM